MFSVIVKENGLTILVDRHLNFLQAFLSKYHYMKYYNDKNYQCFIKKKID